MGVYKVVALCAASGIAGALGVTMLAARSEPQPAVQQTGQQDAQQAARGRVAELEAEVVRLERAVRQAEAAPAPDPEVAPDAQEARLYRDAERLGVVREIGRSRTGLTARQEQRLAVAIVREARVNGLDPLLVAAVIRIESSFDSYAISNAGALGLMQLMPDTGLWLARRRDEPLAHARYLFDFERNVTLGSAYLADLVRQFGRIDHALLAYNIGPAAARKLVADKEASKPALEGYPRKVLAEFARIREGAAPVQTASRGAEGAEGAGSARTATP